MLGDAQGFQAGKQGSLVTNFLKLEIKVHLHMFLKTFGVRMGSAVTLCSLVSTYICPRQTADY